MLTQSHLYPTWTRMRTCEMRLSHRPTPLHPQDMLVQWGVGTKKGKKPCQHRALFKQMDFVGIYVHLYRYTVTIIIRMISMCAHHLLVNQWNNNLKNQQFKTNFTTSTLTIRNNMYYMMWWEGMPYGIWLHVVITSPQYYNITQLPVRKMWILKNILLEKQ